MTVLGWIAVPILLGCVALLVIAVTTDIRHGGLTAWEERDQA